jgi:hypothetical protein
MKIICTICSKDKNKEEGLLPAYLRYTSSRIAEVKKISDTETSSFYILSGVYGLLKDDENIPYYDHLLLQSEVNTLSPKVEKQIQDLDINEIEFYAKPKDTPGWAPYYEVMERSTSKTNTTLKIFTL